MTKKMLIDAAHNEEMRVVIADEQKLYEFDVETAGKAQLKGNIYVAEISRVEPSLQAAFVTFGGNRNGFMAFNEVHPSWFDVSKTEKTSLLKELKELAAKRQAQRAGTSDDAAQTETADDTNNLSQEEMDADARALAIANDLSFEDGSASDDNKPKTGRNRRNKKQDDAKNNERAESIHRRYKIEDVLKGGQKILVQVVKEERGSKGAALTTYYSLPGRFTVLMPNTPHAGGISRKIHDSEEREALKTAYDALKIPDDMGLIIRTAGVGQSKEAIKKDFKNLTSLWKNIQKKFDAAEPITCVHEDGSVVLRNLRDLTSDNVEEIIIEGKRTYKQAKDFAKSLMPEIASSIKEHKKDTPIFIEYGIEQHLTRLHYSRVVLPSGGYLVINPTEALVSIDINSGKATQEKSIESTALKTNLEAAEEICRQLRLRDLAGLVVIDFIDMEDYRHSRQVERAMRKFVRKDRARIQVGQISNFGLMELSRQRLRPSFGESHFVTCTHCNGSGLSYSIASAALLVLRRLEEEDARDADQIIVSTQVGLVTYLLNHKRDLIRDMEAKYKYQILFHPSATHTAPDFLLELVRYKADGSEIKQQHEILLREQPELPPELRPRPSRKRNERKPSERRNSRKNTKDTKADTATNTKGQKTKAADKETANEANVVSDASAATPVEKEKKATRKRPQRKRASAKAESTSPDAQPAAKPVEEKPVKKIVEDRPVVVEQVSAEADATLTEISEKTTGLKFQRWWSKTPE